MVKVRFFINYWTQVGQHLAIVGDAAPFGNWNAAGARRFNYVGSGNWELEFYFDGSIEVLHYNFVILDSNGWSTWESGEHRTLNLKDLAGLPGISVYATWRAPQSAEVSPDVNSSLFSQVIYGRPKQQQQQKEVSVNNEKHSQETILIRWELHAVYVPPGHSVRVCGSVPAIGSWNPVNAPKLKDGDFPVWKLNLRVPRNQVPFAYKFVICDENGHHANWEEGPDRYFNDFRSAAFVQAGSFARYHEWRGAGMAIPIFAIRTAKGLGVGEFLDIKLLVDWANQSGLRVVQILPINDTSVRGNWKDSYPYSSLSVFALHPMYIHLPGLTTDTALLNDIATKAKALNALDKVDYEAVMDYKTKMLKQLYSASKKDFIKTPEFQEWFQANERWLAPYALFCVFRDQYGTCDYAQWDENRNMTKERVRELTGEKSALYDQVAYYYYVQWNLHKQLKEATNYAKEHRIALKGDIAIGVNPKSVDTWVEPTLFRLDKSTGAPPDFFSSDGQNWGFPTYNWAEMSKDDFSWWRARLTHMAQYFDAYRIDHILGFFRIWEIPGNCVSGLLGRFFPSIPVHRNELSDNGIWDVNRLLDPYIRSHLLEHFFGGDAVAVQEKYFDNVGFAAFRFKPAYASEKQIYAALPTEPSSTLTEAQARENGRIREGLLRLLQNVVLLRDDNDENAFYPRIEMYKTSSYLELPNPHKDALMKIYVDYFYRRQEGLWSETALQRLPMMVQATKMLCCGEDLGMVPACVAPVMSRLRILGLRIQRMPDDPKKEFYHPGEYGHLIVCTPSVHDTSTLRGWWEEDRDTTQRFYNNVLGEYGPAPRFCEAHIVGKIVWQHLCSRAMWAVFPIQDLFGLKHKYFEGRNPNDERINVPSNPEHYWRYRMHVPVEELLKDGDFSALIKDMVRSSGRMTTH